MEISRQTETEQPMLRLVNHQMSKHVQTLDGSESMQAV